MWSFPSLILDMAPLVAFVLIQNYILPEQLRFSAIINVICLLACSIPITYYIGMAISRYKGAQFLLLTLFRPFLLYLTLYFSIAAKTNYMWGAILNASFGSMTELILYSSAIRQGGLDELV